MSEQNSPTDDDRQTPANIDENTSETISNHSTESVSIHDERSTTQLTHVRVCPVKIENVWMLPNLTIKHPNRTDENDPFPDDKRIIDDKHVKVSHINRSILRRLTTDMSLLRVNTYARRKSSGTIVVSLPTRRTSNHISNDKQLLSRQDTVRINRISTTDTIKQNARQKRVPSKIKENVIHVSIKRQNTTK